MSRKSVGVFLSASERVSDLVKEEAYLLGQGLAQAGFRVVYGGANCGCMGRLAKGVLSQKGELIGVVPEMDFLTGLVQEGLHEKILVPNLSQRKVRMMEESDMFVVFPGGIGTLDEVTDVLALNGLMEGQASQPKAVLFYNHLGFWSPFLECLEIMEQQRMLSTPVDQMYQVFDRLPDMIGYLSGKYK